MQLVHVIQVGMDVDGDGSSALDRSRIYYFGQSFGGAYGAVFLGVAPDVLVGVPNAAGGPGIDANRLSPFNRPPVRKSLGGAEGNSSCARFAPSTGAQKVERETDGIIGS